MTEKNPNILPGYDHELYLKNCKKMVRLNQKKLEETLAEYNKETNPIERENLGAEIRGWENWVNVWKDRLASAEQIER